MYGKRPYFSTRSIQINVDPRHKRENIYTLNPQPTLNVLHTHAANFWATDFYIFLSEPFTFVCVFLMALLGKPSIKKSHVSMDTLRGGGAQPHSIAFGGVSFLTSQKLSVD